MATKPPHNSRPCIQLHPDVLSFKLPTSLHPALAAMDIEDWTYRGFARLDSERGVALAQAVRGNTREKGDSFGVSYLCQAIALNKSTFSQPFEQLKDIEVALSHYIRLRLRSRVKDSVNVIQKLTELQMRETLVFDLVMNIMESSIDGKCSSKNEQECCGSGTLVMSFNSNNLTYKSMTTIVY
ncbi:hypothetical protein BC936DRAFT_148775 [Jimgerdemannia flammicorona]|uniref:Uncharacterized protein n=1 Tax=Jimgerdemannia flammicorona TaxID=994334 RepID=A0A433D2B0_9FUNG|nr:hypothetical protein BC936DRAFT_148775 [Jimgerdemannia flammicorona]